MANEVSIQITAENTAGPAVAAATQGSNALAGSVRSVGETAGGILAANTITNLGKSVGAFAQQAINAGDEIFATAQKMGVSTDALQEMRFWADQNGVSMQAMERAVGTLNQRVGEAEAGNTRYAEAFEKLGVELTDAQGQIRDTETVMRETIAALLEIEDPAARAAAAAEIFGTRMARELLPALNDSSLSLEEATKRAHELGIVMDSEAVAASDAFADSMSELQQTGAAVLRDFLMPVVQFLSDKILPVLTDAAAGFRELPGPVAAVAAGVAILAGGMLLLAPRILAARSALLAFGLSARAANLALGGIGIALVAITMAISAFGDQQSDSANSVAELTASLDRQTGALTDQTREIIANKLERAGLLEQADELGISTSDLVDAILGEEDAWNRVNRAIDDGKTKFEGAEGAIALNREGLQRLRGEVDKAQDSWERQTDAVEGATAANMDHLESLQEVADQLRAQIDPAFALIEAQEELEEAQRGVTEAERDHGKRSPEYRAALRDEAKAALAVLAAAGELGDEFTGSLSRAQKQMLRDAGLSDAAIRRLEKDLRDARREASRLDGTRVDLSVVTHYSYTGVPSTASQRPGSFYAHGGIKGAASGGMRSDLTMVGEHGPELVDLAPGSQVHSNPDTMRMMQSGWMGGMGGGQPIVVNLKVYLDGREVRGAVVEAVEEKVFSSASFRSTLRDAVGPR